MTMHKVLHSRDDVGRLYVSRKGGERLGSIEDSVDASIQRKEDNIKMRKENNCMDIPSNKQEKCHTRKLGCDYERKTLREKLNFF